MSADTALSDDLRLEPSPFALVEDFDETDPPVAGGIAQPSRLLAAARLLAYVGLTLALLPLQVAFTALRLPPRHRLPRFYHGLCTWLIGLAVTQRGTPVRRGPVLYVANHVSYFDITALGALIDTSFVAKSEVASWPVYGLLARLQDSVFLQRRRQESRRHADTLSRRLAQGGRLVLFAEGTSSDGTRVLPFKTTAFAATMAPELRDEVTVQPVSIAYTHLDGTPIGRAIRPFVAWYGDMELAPHLWDALGLGAIGVTVTFHAPVRPGDFADRKALARHSEAIVAAGLSRAIAGRD